jgi:hypothetical protein
MPDKYTIMKTEGDDGCYLLCEVFREPKLGCLCVHTDSGVTFYLKALNVFETEEQAREALRDVGGPEGRGITH